MPRKNYTPAERALHILGTLAGKSRQEINAAVAYSDAVKWVKAAFLEVVKHQHTNLMMDREPDEDGDALYWEIDNQVLREFAASIGVEIPE